MTMRSLKRACPLSNRKPPTQENSRRSSTASSYLIVASDPVPSVMLWSSRTFRPLLKVASEAKVVGPVTVIPSVQVISNLSSVSSS